MSWASPNPRERRPHKDPRRDTYRCAGLGACRRAYGVARHGGVAWKHQRPAAPHEGRPYSDHPRPPPHLLYGQGFPRLGPNLASCASPASTRRRGAIPPRRITPHLDALLASTPYPTPTRHPAPAPPQPSPACMAHAPGLGTAHHRLTNSRVRYINASKRVSSPFAFPLPPSQRRQALGLWFDRHDYYRTRYTRLGLVSSACRQIDR